VIPPVQRRARLAAGLAILALFGLAWLIHPLVTHPKAPTFCVFRIVTRKPCLFCGMTRAFASAARGHWRAATEYHPLWWLAAAILAATAAILLTDAATGRDGSAAARRAGRRLFWPVAVVWITVCVARIFR
jgi:hypothetical protein